MDTSTLSDDQLDKLFQLSVENIDNTFNPANWQELEKRLNAQGGTSIMNFWRHFNGGRKRTGLISKYLLMICFN